MAKTTHTLTIDRPPAQVFMYIDDTEHAKKWLSGLVEITPLTEGGNRVGAKSRHLYNENGREFEMEEEMLIYEPNRRVKIKGEASFFDLTAEYTLTDTNGSTRLDFESDITFHNPFLRLLSPFMAASSRKKVTQDLERMKALVEAST